MSDDNFTISAETLKAAKNKKDTSKKKNRVKWVVSSVLAVAVVGGFSYGMWEIFKPPVTIQGTYTLENNLPRKGVLQWGASGDFKADNVDTPTGTWTLNNQTGEFLNTQWEGCSMYWNKTVGDTGTFQSDREDTDRYTKQFFDGKESFNQGSLFPVKKGADKVGEVEMKQSWFRDDGNNYAVAFYRQSPANSLTLFGTVRCADEAKLNELVPRDATGEQLSTKFDVWLETK